MEIKSKSVLGAFTVKNPIFDDNRGSFQELYHKSRFIDNGLPNIFVQDNISISHKGVLRGLHMQTVNPQGKLVTCLNGEVYDVCVDLRPRSPTFKKWCAVVLNPELGESFYIPPGCAHGFLSLQDDSVLHYKCTTEYNKASDSGLFYNDLSIGILWPTLDVPYIISDKDLRLPTIESYITVCGAV